MWVHVERETLDMLLVIMFSTAYLLLKIPTRNVMTWSLVKAKSRFRPVIYHLSEGSIVHK